MKILIIDDESKKVGRIKKVIREIEGIHEENIKNALDLNQAKCILKSEYIDFIILDLNIPEFIGDTCSNEMAGLDFIDEILEIDHYIRPRDILILTEFEELIGKYRESENRIIFPIVKFDESSSEWERIIRSRIEYFQICDRNKLFDNAKYDYDVAIITAVEVETKAVKRLCDNWHTSYKETDPTVYYFSEFNRNDRKIKVVTAQQSEMGMAAASTLTSKIMHHYKPKYIIMVGIAAGVGKDKNFGDIIVASEVWNYSSGKYVAKSGTEDLLNFEPDPKSLSLDPMLSGKMSIDYSNILFEIKNKWHDDVSTELKIIIGPLACGNAVVANEKIVQHLIQAHSRKTAGLDMESYGMFYATQNSYGIKATPICIKSICDFADAKKGDGFHSYSAYTSSQFAKYLIENTLQY